MSTNYFVNELNMKMSKISSMLKKIPLSKSNTPLFDPTILDDESTLKNDEYYELFSAALIKKVEIIQKDNERLINRLHFVKKLTKRRNKDVALLKARLDTHGDNWRTAEPETLLKLDKLSVQDFLVQSSPNGNTLFAQPVIGDQSCFKTPAPKRPYVRKTKSNTVNKTITNKSQINRQMFNKSQYNRQTLSKTCAISKQSTINNNNNNNKQTLIAKQQNIKKRVYKPRKTMAEKTLTESQLMRPPVTPYTNYYKETIVHPTILDDLKRKYNQGDLPQFIPSTSKQTGATSGNNTSGGRRWTTMNLNQPLSNNKTTNNKPYF